MSVLALSVLAILMIITVATTVSMTNMLKDCHCLGVTIHVQKTTKHKGLLRLTAANINRDYETAAAAAAATTATATVAAAATTTTETTIINATVARLSPTPRPLVVVRDIAGLCRCRYWCYHQYDDDT